MDAYGAQFESLFVILHPFVSVPEDLAWTVTKKYPADEQILTRGSKFPWAGVAAQSGIGNCARLNQAMLTSTRAIAPELCDFQAGNALQSFLQSGSVWMPGSGAFEPLLQMDYLDAFATSCHEELIFVPEFPNVDPVQRLDISRLRNRQEPFPYRGTLVAPDKSFLLTVDWDSFFTIFYGPRDFVAEVARQQNLEGFFATPTTEHFWFNYSLGCCVITLAPEVWQPA